MKTFDIFARLQICAWLGMTLLVSGCSEKLPKGQSGPTADQLAHSMQEAINLEAWQQTGAVSWQFRNHTHLWDRERHFSQVEWGNNRVLVELTNQSGVAFVRGERISGEKADKLVEKAWLYWVNDAFWLNAPAKAFDGGTSRAIVSTDGDKQLLVSYSSGGATPGDAYLWKLAPGTQRPQSWRMWVSVIPIGGVEASWEGWQQLESGAWIAPVHKLGPATLDLRPVRGTSTLRELVGDEDPFAPLLE